METEKKMVLQAFERRGNLGFFWYGEEDSDEKTWVKKVIRFRNPVVRSRRECMEEQKRLLKLGVYEDESIDNTVRN